MSQVAGLLKILKHESVDLVCFTKTWLNESDNDTLSTNWIQVHSASSVPRTVGEGYNYKEHFTLIRESTAQTVKCECLYIRLS